MSKASELRVLRYGRSVDAPVNYRHRTGDVEGDGGSMLDFYAHTESAEEFYLDGEDELAKAKFLKGFSGYLRKVFSAPERKFLNRLMSGKEKPHEVGRALGVDWFKYMQSLQHKAYKNVKPLLKLAEFTGWTRAEEFTAIILRRLSLLNAGAELSELLPKSFNRAKAREALKATGAENYAAHRIDKLYYLRKWRKNNFERFLASKMKYRETHRAEEAERTREWRKANKERKREYNRAYDAAHREEMRSYQKAYQAAHREELKAYQKAYQAEYRARKKAEKEAAKLAAEAAALAAIADVLENVEGVNV